MNKSMKWFLLSCIVFYTISHVTCLYLTSQTGAQYVRYDKQHWRNSDYKEIPKGNITQTRVLNETPDPVLVSATSEDADRTDCFMIQPGEKVSIPYSSNDKFIKIRMTTCMETKKTKCFSAKKETLKLEPGKGFRICKKSEDIMIVSN